MKKVLLLLLMFVSCCMIPLSAATLSGGRCFAMRQTVCDDYDEESSDRKDDEHNGADTDDMYDVGNCDDAGEVEEDDNDNGNDDNDTTDILTTGVVVKTLTL